ncbi:hypothetical protein BSKO_02027 [Bryopsis sp. KO-2023]|nr:hypothetical protein BSKO_02027 [Bryopsis sp. KO-2023]
MAKVVLSDIDGTIAHYTPDLELKGKIHPGSDEDGLVTFQDERGEAHKLIKLPLSSTSKRGYISLKTVEKINEVRAAKIPFALVTGSRTSTLEQRIPYLPVADAYASENGGRIFFRHPSVTTAFFLKEDLGWRSRHDAAAGPHDQETLAPEKRTGSLWDLYRKLKEDGYSLDCRGHSTCMRVVSIGGGKTFDDLKKLLAEDYPEIKCTWNLGRADLYPKTSGKLNAGLYIMKHFNAHPSNCVFLCDDDNDLELAREVGQTFLPSITTDSVKQAILENPKKLNAIQGTSGTMATEKALDLVLDHLGIEK